MTTSFFEEESYQTYDSYYCNFLRTNTVITFKINGKLSATTTTDQSGAGNKGGLQTPQSPKMGT